MRDKSGQKTMNVTMYLNILAYNPTLADFLMKSQSLVAKMLSRYDKSPLTLDNIKIETTPEHKQKIPISSPKLSRTLL